MSETTYRPKTCSECGYKKGSANAPLCLNPGNPGVVSLAKVDIKNTVASHCMLPKKLEEYLMP